MKLQDVLIRLVGDHLEYFVADEQITEAEYKKLFRDECQANMKTTLVLDGTA